MLYGCFIYAMPIVIYKVLIIQPSSPLQLPCRYVFIFELFCLDEYTTLPIDFLENNRVVLMLLGWKDDVLSLSLSLSYFPPPPAPNGLFCPAVVGTEEKKRGR